MVAMMELGSCISDSSDMPEAPVPGRARGRGIDVRSGEGIGENMENPDRRDWRASGVSDLVEGSGLSAILKLARPCCTSSDDRAV